MEGVYYELPRSRLTICRQQGALPIIQVDFHASIREIQLGEVRTALGTFVSELE